tara:strand:- start:1186 stop:1614 length:429 start_codon:yes stop_codon:yes gene_type:complete
MSTQSDQNEQRIKLYWYLALIVMPLIVALLLLNADPYERVQLNQVVELRTQLAQQDVGSEVIAWLDAKGGHNLSEAEWAALQAADAEQLYFMLTSSTLSPSLKQAMAAALVDGYVTQQEYQDYQIAAAAVLMTPALLTQFGY